MRADESVSVETGSAWFCLISAGASSKISRARDESRRKLAETQRRDAARRPAGGDTADRT